MNFSKRRLKSIQKNLLDISPKKQHYKNLLTESPSWDKFFLKGSRFIDFTRNFWIAMYFAWDQYNEEKDKPNHGAFWIIDLAMLMEVQGFPNLADFEKQEFLEYYSRFQSVNQNNTRTAVSGFAVAGQMQAGKPYEIIQDDPHFASSNESK
jgi:hypothetical protein